MLQRATKWSSENKHLSIPLTIILYLGLGALAHMSLIQDNFWVSLWWSIKHLIDPGFIGDDYVLIEGKVSVAHAILGTAFTVLGLILFMFIFIELVTSGGSRLMDRVMNGSLPRDMRGHLIIIGSADRLIPFVNQGEQKLRALYQVKEVALIVDSDEGMKRLNRFKIDDFDLYRMNIHDFKRSKVSLQSHLAKHIMILSEDESHVGDMVYLVDQIYEERMESVSQKLRPLNITIEIKSDHMERVLQRFLSSHRLGQAQINVRLIDMMRLEARHVLKSFPLDGRSSATIRAEKRALLVILGWSALGRSFVDQVRSSGLYNMKSTEIYQLSLDDDEPMELNEFFPEPDPDDMYQARLKVLEIQQPSAYDLQELIVAGWDDESIAQVTVLSCGRQGDEVVRHAVEWESYLEVYRAEHQEQMPILVELPEDSSYRQVFDSDPSLKHFHVTSSEQEVLNTLNELDALPKRAHERYIEMMEGYGARAKRADGRYVSVSHNDWDFLPYACQNWNRSTVDHFEIKLRLIANEYQLPHPTFDFDGRLSSIDGEVRAQVDAMVEAYQGHKDLDEAEYAAALKDTTVLQFLETLAELEHDRWSSERYIQGWRYDETRRDPLRLHPSLVEYDQLTHKEKVKDRNNVIENLTEHLDGLKS